MAYYERLRKAVARLISSTTGFGETVTLRQRTLARDSEDDQSWTNSDSSITAAIVIADIKQSMESKGVLRVGDARVYIKQATNVSEGNLIYHQGIWYSVKSIAPVWSEGYKVCTECHCNPMEKFPSL